jgi:hypothetical protein
LQLRGWAGTDWNRVDKGEQAGSDPFPQPWNTHPTAEERGLTPILDGSSHIRVSRDFGRRAVAGIALGLIAAASQAAQPALAESCPDRHVRISRRISRAGIAGYPARGGGDTLAKIEPQG